MKKGLPIIKEIWFETKDNIVLDGMNEATLTILDHNNRFWSIKVKANNLGEKGEGG